jgi:hypothetical protein
MDLLRFVLAILISPFRSRARLRGYELHGLPVVQGNKHARIAKYANHLR